MPARLDPKQAVPDFGSGWDKVNFGINPGSRIKTGCIKGEPGCILIIYIFITGVPGINPRSTPWYQPDLIQSKLFQILDLAGV